MKLQRFGLGVGNLLDHFEGEMEMDCYCCDSGRTTNLTTTIAGFLFHPRPEIWIHIFRSITFNYTYSQHNRGLNLCMTTALELTTQYTTFLASQRSSNLKLRSEIHDVLYFTSRRKFNELILVCKFLFDVWKFLTYLDMNTVSLLSEKDIKLDFVVFLSFIQFLFTWGT